jgi:hypothetical protein
MNGQTVQLRTQAEAARMSGYSVSTIRRLILKVEIRKVVPAPGMNAACADAAAIEETATGQRRTEHERAVRRARLELARRQQTWTEIPETRLVRRGPFLVDSVSDLVFTIRGGHVFEPGKAVVGYVPVRPSGRAAGEVIHGGARPP